MGDVLNLIVVLALFAYGPLCLHVIATKTGADNPWFAWIPILNLFLLCEVAGMSYWWILGLFIPVFNILAFTLLWVGLAEQRGKPFWVGILIIVPFVNLIVPGYLAFSD
jgi:hypothetical protein